MQEPITRRVWCSCKQLLLAMQPTLLHAMDNQYQPEVFQAIIYYYTPLPLNLANKQQATSDDHTLLLSILAITPSQ